MGLLLSDSKRARIGMVAFTGLFGAVAGATFQGTGQVGAPGGEHAAGPAGVKAPVAEVPR